jgi:hypothetical protein
VRYLGNRISGGAFCLTAELTPDGRIEGNEIFGCQRGLQISEDMLQSGTAVGNIVRDSQEGLALRDWGGGHSAGALVSFNDFIGNTTAVVAERMSCDEFDCIPVSGYDLPTVLPHNHWGSTCEPAGLPEAVSTPQSYARPVAERFRTRSSGAAANSRRSSWTAIWSRSSTLSSNITTISVSLPRTP